MAADTNDPCHAWVERFRGRVGRAGAGSFAVWTKRTPSGFALVTGAVHSLGSGALGEDGEAASQRLAPPEQEGVLRLALPRGDGALDATERAVAFRFFNPAIPGAEYASPFGKLRPRHDFYVDVMDGQRYAADDLLEPLPNPLTPGPVPLHDPAELASATPTFGSPAPGAIVAYAGFPRVGALAGAVAVGFGRVLSDDEARATLATLAKAGDEEGVLPYDAEAEMLLEGEGFVGMSGGGVFDREGRLAGVLVRASTAASTKRYVRAVRMSFVAGVIASARDELPVAARSAVDPYLPLP